MMRTTQRCSRPSSRASSTSHRRTGTACRRLRRTSSRACSSWTRRSASPRRTCSTIRGSRFDASLVSSVFESLSALLSLTRVPRLPCYPTLCCSISGRAQRERRSAAAFHGRDEALQRQTPLSRGHHGGESHQRTHGALDQEEVIGHERTRSRRRRVCKRVGGRPGFPNDNRSAWCCGVARCACVRQRATSFNTVTLVRARRRYRYLHKYAVAIYLPQKLLHRKNKTLSSSLHQLTCPGASWSKTVRLLSESMRECRQSGRDAYSTQPPCGVTAKLSLLSSSSSSRAFWRVR